MKTAIGGLLVLIGLCVGWIGSGVSVAGLLIEAAGNYIGEPLE